MHHLLLTILFLSSIALAQEGITGADEASLNRDESGNPILLKTNKLAAPTTSAAQHQQTDPDFLRERAEVFTNTPLGNAKLGDVSCPDGTGAACLDIGDKVCPGSTKCVDVGATCFDEYPCDLSKGFVCESTYDDVLDELKQAVRQHDELALENVALRERRLEQKNCVLNAATLDNAKRCVQRP
jgi:hypothetical protein